MAPTDLRERFHVASRAADAPHTPESSHEDRHRRDEPVACDGKPRRGIIAALTGTAGAELGRRGSVDSNVARATQRAVEQAGIRPRLHSRRVGDYELGAPLGEGDGWQDFLAKHVSLGVARRVRVYPFARAASPEERKRLGRMAAREFRVLEGIDHPGILRVLHFEESELGPALVFEHDPAAMRLDQFLAQHLKDLTLDERLDLLRQLAVGLGYAHGKRLYHQGLTPQNVLVREPTSARPRVQIMNWQVAARGEGSAVSGASVRIQVRRPSARCRAARVWTVGISRAGEWRLSGRTSRRFTEAGMTGFGASIPFPLAPAEVG
jgi:serine/threonine protein kinase